VLILRRELLIPSEKPYISYEHLGINYLTIKVDLLGEVLISKQPLENNDENYNQTLSDVISVIPTLQKGMDINLHFKSPSSFEITPQLCVFDILNVNLFHAWVLKFNIWFATR
jgi:hypothetical protein